MAHELYHSDAEQKNPPGLTQALLLLQKELSKTSDPLAVKGRFHEFINMDIEASHTNDVDALFTEHLKKFGPLENCKLVLGIQNLAKNINPEYKKLTAKHLCILSYNEKLNAETQLIAASSALSYLSVENAACGMAADRVLTLADVSRRENDLDNYLLIRNALVKSDNAPDVQKKAFTLWEKATKNIKILDTASEIQQLALLVTKDSPIKQKLLPLWNEAIKVEYKDVTSSLTSTLASTANAIADWKLRDVFAETAIKNWEEWRKEAETEPRQKTAFIKAGEQLAQRLYKAKLDEINKPHIAEILTRFKDLLTEDLLAQMPYKKDEAFNEKLILTLGRYNGRNTKLRKSILEKLETMLEETGKNPLNNTGLASFLVNIQRAYLGFPDERDNKKGDNKPPPKRPDF